ncbi:hypothetical protein K788_0009088 [Paraburkholderia caribensis MBA4]|uniref:Uncharacterized protein n=1 Tax=Paraburkholderia caribensis MBA4 TaxID=1323664 RepID=A0A0N7JTK1_9BURK|nr:hypothetical protein K788_0009088 [Paraburkholderia caribensis MBA4]
MREAAHADARGVGLDLGSLRRTGTARDCAPLPFDISSRASGRSCALHRCADC